jgi:hypothetical protein
MKSFANRLLISGSKVRVLVFSSSPLAGSVESLLGVGTHHLSRPEGDIIGSRLLLCNSIPGPTLPAVIAHNKPQSVQVGALGQASGAWVFLRLLVRTHRSEIMLGVLVIILCPNGVADLGFGTGER